MDTQHQTQDDTNKIRKPKHTTKNKRNNKLRNNSPMDNSIHNRNDKMRKTKNKGVPSGYKHLWTYKGKWDEKKIRKGLWRFTFTATKGKKGRRTYGSFGKGTTGAWKINAIQYIRKTSPTSYQTKMIGTKKPLKFNIRRNRKWNR